MGKQESTPKHEEHQTSLRISQPQLLLTLIIFLSIGLRLWNVGWSLPQFGEEGIPLRTAYEMWNGEKGGFDFSPSTFVYPAFTFYLQFIIQSVHFLVGSLIGAYHGADSFRQVWTTDPSAFVVIGRITSILFDLGSIILAYLIGRRHLNTTAGIVAAVFVAVNPLHIQEAHWINVDTPLTFFVLLTLYYAYRLAFERDRKWYIASGISIGLATATKYNGALLILLLLTAHVLPAKSIKEAIRSLKSWSVLIACLLTALVFAASNPYIFLRFGDFARSFSEVETHMAMGHLGLDKNTSTVSYYFLESLPRSIGLPLLIICIISFTMLLLKRERRNFLLVSFPVYYLCTIGSWAMRADRYIFPIVPILLIICAIGMCQISELLFQRIGSATSRRSGRMKIPQQIITGVLAAILMVAPAYSTLKYQHQLSLPETQLATTRWIKQHLPPKSAIATGPFGIDLKNDDYLILDIPFNAGGTEKTFGFYDTRWYEDCDIVVTSDYDYGRYLEDPARFHDILKFYDTLRSKWSLVYSVTPGDSLRGPTFWLYRPPHSPRDTFELELIRKLGNTADSAETLRFLRTLSEICAVKGKFAKSEELLLILLDEDPQDYRSMKNLAYVEHNLHNDANALQITQIYLATHPDDASQLSLQGDILFSLNRPLDAETALTQALKLNPRLEGPYLTLNLIYSRRGDKAAMADILTRYLSILPPNSPKAQRVQSILSALKASS